MTTPICTARPLILDAGVPQEAPDTAFVQIADVALSGSYFDLTDRPDRRDYGLITIPATRTADYGAL
jgi:hypothetical protein